MAKLLAIIPPQRFEIVRDRIGEILAEELNNQYVLRGSARPELKPVVWIERIVPIDLTDLPSINVALINGDYDNKDITSVDGTYHYSIDVYTGAKSSSGVNGDQLAGVNLQKILGMCRAILENPGYKTLGYTPPLISGVMVSGISIGEPVYNHDSVGMAQGRLVLTVRVPEVAELGTGVLLADSDTSVKLYETDLGYMYQFQRGETVIGDDDINVIGDDGVQVNIDPDGVGGDDSESIIGDDNIITIQ